MDGGFLSLGDARHVSLWSVAALMLVCTAIYVPFTDKGPTNDDLIYLDYADRLTLNPARCQVSDYVFQGRVLENFVVFESTHPPLVPYYIRVVRHLVGRDLVHLHLAFLPFLWLATLGLAGLIRHYTDHPPWVALALTLGPMFLPNAATLMTDVPLFAFWVGGLWYWERTLARTGASATRNLIPCLIFTFAAVFTAYQGFGLLALIAVRGWSKRRMGEVLIVFACTVVPMVIWLSMVYYYHGIVPYFAAPRDELSIATEVHKGLDATNMWIKARVMVLYGGAAIGLFAPLALRLAAGGRFFYPLMACLGWAWVLLLNLQNDTGWFPGFWAWGLMGLGLALLPSLFHAVRSLFGIDEEGSIWLVLLAWFAGLALFQIGLAAFASPRYNLLLFAALLLMVLRATPPRFAAVTVWTLISTGIAVGLGWMVARVEFDFSRAQRVADLELPVAPGEIHFVGEMGVRHYGEQAGMIYLQVDQTDDVRYLLVPRLTDHIQVPESLLARAEIAGRYEVPSRWPLRLHAPDHHTSYYLHARGILPFSFVPGPGTMEAYTLFKVYHQIMPAWVVGPESRIEPAGPILPESPIVTEFDCPKDGLTRVRLNLATYNRINTSTLRVAISELGLAEAEESLLWSVDLDAAQIRDNSWLTLDLEPLASAGKRLRLALSSPDATPANAVTIWVNRAGAGGYRYGETVQAGQLGLSMFCFPRAAAGEVETVAPNPSE
ncbi:hypothetical protein SCOR_17320 [Sulfidibacter corallicola]|uniref:Glycosyltransferase RgtA/B/C/D-like domain-containing protein n=1 Tax=Sulfidibacter corallicola TaxID=2818388 RepID=A0A8A4TXT5_SULCO|nr:glycosyltransferase family 39 protein [Sulfidibacter corallicola]QTD53782.1 hypothetical protein J3U87_15135 [Sulfidibacter corallicola]